MAKPMSMNVAESEKCVIVLASKRVNTMFYIKNIKFKRKKSNFWHSNNNIKQALSVVFVSFNKNKLASLTYRTLRI